MLDTKTLTATTDGVEGVFRMGEVLQAKKDLDYAIEKYEEVVDETEKIVFMNPDSSIEVRWAVLALGNMSDIYTEREDWKKALALREIQNEFLCVMSKTPKQSSEDSSDDEDNFYEITTIGRQFNELFKKARKAIDMPCKPPSEDPQELARKFVEARKKDEEAEISNTIEKINNYVKAKEDEINGSFFKRNTHRATNHPIIFVLFVFFIAALMILGFKLMCKHNDSVKREKMAKVNAYMRANGLDSSSFRKPMNRRKTGKQKKPKKGFTREL